ncbi:MAG: transglutaminase domain-containing protein [Methanobacterium sp.]
MKKKWVVLMLITLTLSSGMTTIAAADQPGNQTVLADQSATGNHTENTDKNIAQTNGGQITAGEPTSAGTVASTTSTKAAGGSSTKAAGSSTTVKTTTSAGSTSTFSDSQIKDAAERVKNFIEKNDRLPNYVTIGSRQISMSQYLQLVNQETLNLYGSSGSLTLKSISGPANPTESVKSGNILKSEYLKLARNILNFMNSNGRAPNYAYSSLGTIRYESLVYMFSRVVAFYGDNSRLPNYVSVKSWTSQTGGTTPGDTTTDPALQKYLVATANAQSTSSTIKNLAASITLGKTTTYAKAQAIFNWVRDHVSYSFYYNTQKGALGAYSSRSANCCDMAHLVVALARAANIPARYQHGTCTFSSGTFGHVWAQLYVSGKWYYADAVSSRNSFGTINNWNLNTYTLHGTYAALPF